MIWSKRDFPVRFLRLPSKVAALEDRIAKLEAIPSEMCPVCRTNNALKIASMVFRDGKQLIEYQCRHCSHAEERLVTHPAVITTQP